MKFNFKKLFNLMDSDQDNSMSYSGFTLAEVMVATGLLGILSLTVVHLTKNMSKVRRSTMQDVSLSSLRLMAFSSLRDTTSCGETLINVDPSGTTNIGSIKNRAGNNIITAGSVFGDSSVGANNNEGSSASKLTITGIVLTNYSADGDPYRSAPGGAVDTLNGNGQVIISYVKGDRTLGGANDDRERQRSLGASSGTISIPVSFSHVHNPASPANPGAILSCNSIANSFSKGICDSFDGNNDIDEKCRHITLADSEAPNNDFAVTFKGNVNIENSDTNANQNELVVDGSVGIGVPPETNINGKLSVAHSLAVGPEANNSAPNTQGDADFDGSIGIGVAPSATAGNLSVNSSALFGSGTLPTAGDGNVDARGSVGVGLDAAVGNTGSLSMSNSIGINKAPSGVAGHMGIEGSISVGAGAPLPSSGSMAVSGYVSIPNQASTESVAKNVATQEWVATKIARTLDPSVVNNVTDIVSDILGGSTDQAAAKSICESLAIRDANGGYSTRGVFSSGVCTITPKYCSTDGQCNVVYAGSGGVNSVGNVLTTGGSITASGDIRTTTGDVRAKNIRANNSLCINTVCKSDWNSLEVTHGSCYNRNSSSSCNDGDFIVGVTLKTKNITYLSSFNVTPNYYSGNVTSISTSKSYSTRTVGDDVTYRCCEARND